MSNFLSNFSKTEYVVTKTFNKPNYKKPIEITAYITLHKNGGEFYFENNLNDCVYTHDGGEYENEKEMFDYLELGWKHYIDRIPNKYKK